ncbi:MAG: OmpA family protein [Acidobacteria bacterium]|nr:OmpA family protein [Acidobacteriota bacterium]MCW5969740.1 OmpA family protein [Blastocatellales bacterium]
MKSTKLLPGLLLVFAASSAWAQQSPQSQPIVNIRISRTIKSVTYRPNSGQSTIGFLGTALLPRAEGKARVQNKQGVTYIEGEISRLEPALKFGSPYLTYVLWAITPEGSASNLGEIIVQGTRAKVKASTNLQSFGLIVTAEPYFAIGMPSEIVVLENVIVPGTMGKIEAVDAKYELLERGKYEPGIFEPFEMDAKTPLELYQARNAARIGAWMQADKYATESWAKAQRELKNAEGFQSQKNPNRRSVMMMARDATQIFEDARVIALKRQEEEQLANERRAARERQEQARAQAEAEAERRKEEAEARRRAELEREMEAARRERAEAEKLKAELAGAQEAQRRAEAEAARARAVAQEEQARRLADEARKSADASRLREEEAQRREAAARREAEQSAREKAELRARLLEQFNAVLETRDTERGLVVNMGDVLFDTGRFTLRQVAQVKLARLAGIVLSYPGLRLESEGHTDNVGGEAFNQKLSEQRANSVREFLISQGIAADRITSIGKAFSMPVADNKTAAGRQRNRRVELIVSGEVIGSKVGNFSPDKQ